MRFLEPPVPFSDFYSGTMASYVRRMGIRLYDDSLKLFLNNTTKKRGRLH